MVESKLKQLREAAGMSQQDLANELGLSRSLVAKMENGKRSIAKHNVKALAEAYGVDREVVEEIRKTQQNYTNGDYVHSRIDFSNWIVAVAESGESADIRAVLASLLPFFDEKSSLAIFTPEEFCERTGLRREFIDRIWKDVLATPFVEAAHPSMPYAVRLTFPSKYE